MIKSIELKFTSGNDVPVERAVITRDEFIQIKQQAETIERLKDKLINAHMTGQAITGDTPSVHLAVDWVNKLEAGEL